MAWTNRILIVILMQVSRICCEVIMFKLKIFFFSLFFPLSLFAKSFGAHTHGEANLDFAVENKTLLIMLSSPSESLLGFEYRPRTKEEKNSVKSLENSWNKDLFGLFNGLQSNCSIADKKFEIKYDGASHSSIEAESYIECQDVVTGKEISISLFDQFKKLKKIKIQHIKADGKSISLIKTKSFKLKL